MIPLDDQIQASEMSVLGISWNTIKDEISLKFVSQHRVQNPTKKAVLQEISRVFDPMGLFAPVVIRAKIFMQTLWKQNLDWCDAVPADLLDLWDALGEDLQNISDKKLSRFIGPSGDGAICELHCFCDASGRAYASAVYLVVRSNYSCTKVNLLFCKTKVAPLKDITIPRLELMAVLIGVRITSFLTKEIPLMISRCLIWSDSKCVLHWIHNEAKVMSVFIENRLKEIRRSDSVEFRFVPTLQNPADIPSRGAGLSEIVENNMWWHGPSWLQEQESAWPVKWSSAMKNDQLSEMDFEPPEFKTNDSQMLVCSAQKLEGPFSISISEFSCLRRLLRVTAWALRFVNCLRSGRSADMVDLSSSEISRARLMWELYIQKTHFGSEVNDIHNGKKNQLVQHLNLFIDDKNLLRCRSRLQHAELDFDAKFPKLMPRLDPFTRLVIEDIHEKAFHAGAKQTLSLLRQTIWITQGRATVQKVLRECIICRQIEGSHYAAPPQPPLPGARVYESYPFTYVGIDHLGPLFIKSELAQEKAWILLFTCATVRAVHLEVVTTLSAEGTLHALRRFVARRGTPKVIISDNARGFKLVNKVLNSFHALLRDDAIQSYSSEKGIQWKFIVELAPWMGGFYERLVGSVKRSLRKGLRNACLSLGQLQTIVIEVESIINSRPLTYVETNLNDNQILTPSKLLFINPIQNFPLTTEDDNDPLYRENKLSADALLQRWKNGQTLLDRFWTSWRTDYLLGLMEKSIHQKTKNTADIKPKVGHVVLIGDKLPRGQWRTGRISKLNISNDGEVRSAIVALPNKKELTRSIRMLFPIEITGETTATGETPSMSTVDNKKPVRAAATQALSRMKNMK